MTHSRKRKSKQIFWFSIFRYRDFEITRFQPQPRAHICNSPILLHPFLFPPLTLKRRILFPFHLQTTSIFLHYSLKR